MRWPIQLFDGDSQRGSPRRAAAIVTRVVSHRLTSRINISAESLFRALFISSVGRRARHERNDNVYNADAVRRACLLNGPSEIRQIFTRIVTRVVAYAGRDGCARVK